MFEFIEVLRAIAVALITNSHFDGVYPWNISWGGCPGVSLFFIISGFLLVKGVKRDNFFPWWGKKVIRLYVPLTIVNLITVMIGYRHATVSLFFFPININLWYVPAITLLYIVYYLVLRLKNGVYRVPALLLTVVVYALSYMFKYRSEFFVEPEVAFRLLYGFIAMLLGSLIYDFRDSEKLKAKRKLWVILGVFSCGGFLFFKLFMNRIPVFLKLQFMTQVFGVAFAAFMMLAGLGYEKEAQRFMKTRSGKIVGMISTCSLEIYLVQFAVIAYLKQLPFPVNFTIIILGVIIIGKGVQIASHLVLKQWYGCTNKEREKSI